MFRILLERGSQSLISRLTLVEIESVLAVKVRSREIDAQGVETVRRCLRADLNQRRLMLGPHLEARHYQSARVLLRRYGVKEGLRTLDALQLADALDLKRSKSISVVVSADQRLVRVARLAGCATVNPAEPGPLVI